MAKKSSTLKTRIGPNVRKAREQAGLTQLALALKIGYKSSNARSNVGNAISLIESGEREPRFSTISKIAKACNVPVAELLY